ncbi:MAG: hypothetical protein ACMXYG_04335 [Candidatus Woesearchaeota archaeon]
MVEKDNRIMFVKGRKKYYGMSFDLFNSLLGGVTAGLILILVPLVLEWVGWEKNICAIIFFSFLMLIVIIGLSFKWDRA